MEASIEQCKKKSRNVFSCPILLALKSFQFDINFDVETEENRTINLQIEVNQTCRYQNLPTAISVEMKIENLYEIVPSIVLSKSNNELLVGRERKKFKCLT